MFLFCSSEICKKLKNSQLLYKIWKLSFIWQLPEMSAKSANLIDTKAELTELIKLKMEKAVSSSRTPNATWTKLRELFLFSRQRSNSPSLNAKYTISRAATWQTLTSMAMLSKDGIDIWLAQSIMNKHIL